MKGSGSKNLTRGRGVTVSYVAGELGWLVSCAGIACSLVYRPVECPIEHG